MSHRPLHMWKLDKDGKPVLDKYGEKIPHAKHLTPKTPKEYTDEERDSIDYQQRVYEARRRATAARIMSEIDEANEVLGRTS